MAFTPNKKTQKNVSDYGVRVARPGYDAGFCAQNQLLFNSNWPILQICEVMKVADMPLVSAYEVEEVETKINTTTGDIISVKRLTYDATSVPSGSTGNATNYFTIDDWGGELKTVRANKKYIEVLVAGNVTVYRYPVNSSTSGNVRTESTKYCRYYARRRKSHRLGYTPFFMRSEDVSSTSGYVVLFSVDIAEDVDYPYTEEPLAMLHPTEDYGIKSSSIFPKVDGLCSNMFSKLVQAVKTQKTAVSNGGGDVRAIWSPVKNAGEATTKELYPYEFYSFIGNTTSGAGIDGGCYYTRDIPYYLTRYSGANIANCWAATVTSTQSVVPQLNSLVVLRSPMVSPEYEERTVS